MIYSQKPIKEEAGIRIFSLEDFYWQVNIDRDQIIKLQEEMKQAPIIEAATKVGINSGYISAYHRSDWVYFLPFKQRPDLRVLDLGAGFGNITIPLAKKMPKAKIYAADASLDLLKVLAKQAEWEDCSNIEYLKVGLLETEKLPFAEKSFDLILMNGVLEWIGAGVNIGNPREQQLAALKHLKSLLKDDGSLYIGIEGRFFPGYFTKVKDPHTQLYYTSVVPRRVADYLCRRAGRPEGYRNYTYSHWGYQKLFREAGFNLSQSETIYPIASYKDPFFLFNYRDHQSYRLAFTKLAKEVFPSWRGRFLFKTLYYVGLEKFFAPSYLFLLSNNRVSDRDRLLGQKISQFVDVSKYEPIKVFGNLANFGFVSFWLIDKISGLSDYVVKIKRNILPSDNLREKIDRLRSFSLPQAIIPIKYNEEIQFFKFYNGKTPPISPESVLRAIDLIKEIHSRTHKVGLIHGDYTLANILDIANDWKIIDWDDFAENQPQIFDVCSLIAHYLIILKQVKLKEAPVILVSDQALSWFRHYDQKINGKDLPMIWESFIGYSLEQYRGRRQSKFEFYERLLVAFSER